MADAVRRKMLLVVNPVSGKKLAKQYMSKYYPVGYERYGNRIASKSYMTGVNHFTWSSSVLADPDGYRNMTPTQILADLFGE